jgi:hypothetical protein
MGRAVFFTFHLLAEFRQAVASIERMHVEGRFIGSRRRALGPCPWGGYRIANDLSETLLGLK